VAISDLSKISEADVEERLEIILLSARGDCLDNLIEIQIVEKLRRDASKRMLRNMAGGASLRRADHSMSSASATGCSCATSISSPVFPVEWVEPATPTTV
jgi:hypothetical protein